MKFNWGHGITLFFAVFVSLVAFFIVFSFRHKNDLVTKDYYKRGANYSEQMKIDQRSVPYKDSIKIKRGATDLEFYFSQTMVENVDSLTLHFFRPSDENLDYHATIAIDSTEVHFDKNLLARGRYEVKMNWQLNHATYYLKIDIQIK